MLLGYSIAYEGYFLPEAAFRPTSPTFVPQLMQNFAPSGSSVPQFMQNIVDRSFSYKYIERERACQFRSVRDVLKQHGEGKDLFLSAPDQHTVHLFGGLPHGFDTIAVRGGIGRGGEQGITDGLDGSVGGVGDDELRLAQLVVPEA